MAVNYLQFYAWIKIDGVFIAKLGSLRCLNEEVSWNNRLFEGKNSYSYDPKLQLLQISAVEMLCILFMLASASFDALFEHFITC